MSWLGIPPAYLGIELRREWRDVRRRALLIRTVLRGGTVAYRLVLRNGGIEVPPGARYATLIDCTVIRADTGIRLPPSCS